MADFEIIEPFIEHQGERRIFWLRKPRAIGEKILLARPGMPIPASQSHRATVFLDFKRAFGTGGHGTTEGCLLALERTVRGGETVLDVGTGTGILAIAARKLGAGHITAIDIDMAACAETRKNLSLNGVENGISVIEGGLELLKDRYDIVAANLRTHILTDIMTGLVERLGDRGIAIFSGILERELHYFLSLLGSHPLDILETNRIQGWMTVVSRMRRPAD